MLEYYFARPRTVDRIRASWIAEAIERYVGAKRAQGFSRSTIRTRVEVLFKFGEFAWCQGARTLQELPEQSVPFVNSWEQELRDRSSSSPRRGRPRRWRVQTPIEGMIELVVPGFEISLRRPRYTIPFAAQAPDFVPYLRNERGLSEGTVRRHLASLRRFERYLQSKARELSSLSPELFREFVERSSRELSSRSVVGLCDSLRGFLRYLHREQILPKDLSAIVERPRLYRLAHVPRSIPWEETRRLLDLVDRRSAVGRRDFAMLLLLVTYGLRAREVASLTLDDIDWKAGHLRISKRKGGHSTHYRLTAAAGDAVADYLEKDRPPSGDRHIFFNTLAPRRPIPPHGVTQRASHWLKKAGISVPRQGAHTLRHTVVQRLLDQDFSLREIGDYVGHSTPNSTQIYTKVDMRHLREIALGNAEEVL